MKKLIGFLGIGIALTFSACTNSTDGTTGAGEEHHHESGAALTLNNGQKWNVDDATSANVAGMKQVVTDFNMQENKTAEAYAALGNTLSDSLNNLISECSTKGEDHEALHKWLEPFMTSVAELKKVTTIGDGETVFKKISERLDVFGTYFE